MQTNIQHNYYPDTLSAKRFMQESKKKVNHRRTSSVDSMNFLLMHSNDITAIDHKSKVTPSGDILTKTRMTRIASKPWNTNALERNPYAPLSRFKSNALSSYSYQEMEEIADEMITLGIPLSKSNLVLLLKTISLHEETFSRTSMPQIFEGHCLLKSGKKIKVELFQLEVSGTGQMLLLFPNNRKAEIARGSTKICIKAFPITTPVQLLARTISRATEDSEFKGCMHEEDMYHAVESNKAPEIYGTIYYLFEKSRKLEIAQHITMQYYRVDMADFLKEKWFISDYDKIFIGQSVAEALLKLHEKNIIHRDIKLENVFLNTEVRMDELMYNNIVLGDLETACFENDEIRRSESRGTSIYISPQILKYLQQERYLMGKPDDVWALGCLFFILFSGFSVPWFEELNELSSLMTIHRQDVTHSGKNDRLIQEIMERMFLFDPTLAIKERPISHILSNIINEDPDLENMLPIIHIFSNEIGDAVKYKQSASVDNRRFLLEKVESCLKKENPRLEQGERRMKLIQSALEMIRLFDRYGQERLVDQEENPMAHLIWSMLRFSPSQRISIHDAEMRLKDLLSKYAEKDICNMSEWTHQLKPFINDFFIYYNEKTKSGKASISRMPLQEKYPNTSYSF